MSRAVSSHNPRVIRVLLRYREVVAVATERAYAELERLGVGEPAVLLPRPLTLPLRGDIQRVDRLE